MDVSWLGQMDVCWCGVACGLPRFVGDCMGRCLAVLRGEVCSLGFLATQELKIVLLAYVSEEKSLAFSRS